MTHNCFISYKKENLEEKEIIISKLGSKRINGSALDKNIDSDDIDYVMEVIRKDYLMGTSVTLYLIGLHSSEDEGLDDKGYNKQSFIIREMQASLYNGKNNRRSGIIGIVLPEMESRIYKGLSFCNKCNRNHNIINISDETTIREFHLNYYLKSMDSGCRNAYLEDGKYCLLVRYSEFLRDPETYINLAYDKINSEISSYVHWRDITHKGKLK